MATTVVEYKCFVGNLPFEIDVESLAKEFAVFGKVTKAEVKRGFGFVTFATEKSMKEAIEGKDGQTIGGRVVVVNQSRPKGITRSNDGGRPHQRPPPKYEVYVGKLQYFTTEETLRAAFGKFGTIREANIATIHDVHGYIYCKGFGFVNFATEKAMKDAIDEMDGEMLDDRSINVKQANGKRSNAAAVAGHPEEVVYECFVSNLSYYTSERSLAKAFGKFGKVIGTKILEQQGDSDEYMYCSKGIGFVTFSTEKERDDAIQGMNGEKLDDRRIFVKQAQAKARRNRTSNE